MNPPKITIKKKPLSEILEVDPSMNTVELIDQEVSDAFYLVAKMLDLALKEIEKKLNSLFLMILDYSPSLTPSR